MTVRFTGRPVSEGAAAGALRIVSAAGAVSATPDEVAAGFAAVAAERSALAAQLRSAGRSQEADIIEVSALIAADPALREPAVALVRDGADAAAAVREAAERQAAVMAGLANRALAERAGDIRQVAEAVVAHLGPRAAAPVPDGAFILVGQEISPADLIEFAESGLVGAVSVTGGASSHAAIVARGLGLPMISGVDPAVLAVPPGQAGVLDADAGELVVGASLAGRVRSSAAEPAEAPPESDGCGNAPHISGTLPQPSEPAGAGPPRTADGVTVTLLCNVASAAETRRGLAEGAEGVGLLRTEIPFVEAAAWPDLARQRAQLAPVLGLLAGRTATVRLFDFSGDKVPPFLRGGSPGGLAALLARPGALADQLTAVLDAGRDTSLAVLIPMVSSPDEVSQVRAALAETAAALGQRPPPLGIMVELRGTAAAAEKFAAADFFSIGTNDLTGDVLGIDRHSQAAGPALAAHPRVLELIKHVAGAGRDAGVPVSVCGDSAADPRVLPLLIGAGIRTLSVPAARVRRVRSWLARLDTGSCATLADRAIQASTADEVWELVPPL